jgi:hypothetical protein
VWLIRLVMSVCCGEACGEYVLVCLCAVVRRVVHTFRYVCVLW